MAELLAPLLRGLMLAFQCGLVGGCVFAWALAIKDERARTLRWAGATAAAAALTALAELAVLLGALTTTLDLPLKQALGAEFVRHALLYIAMATLAALLCRRAGKYPDLALVSAVAVVAASAASGHAASRLEGRLALFAADFVHQLAAGIWLGGIPYLLGALRTHDGQTRIRICRRFSAIAAACVTVLLGSAVALAGIQVGSWPAMIGTDFGAMALVKAALLGLLLLLGLGNLLSGPRLDQMAPLRRLRAFAVAEMGLGLAVLMLAASLAQQPPPAEVPGQVMSLTQLLSQLTPERWPRFLASVPLVPGSWEDRAWSEMTHHWAGLVMLAMGLLAFARTLPGFAWARHWPLLFLIIAAGNPLVSDPDSWPWGANGFWGRPGDFEVVEHRLAALLVVVFALSEWAVQTGRRGGKAALVFPVVCWLGGLLLMLHSHANQDARTALPIHLTHMALAVLGLTAGAGRWVELKADSHTARLAGRVWPLALAMVGVLLLLYRET